MKILIVEDSAEMRKSIRSIVADKTDTIIECENGAEALTEYKNEKPDYVLMDINMPVMNGIETTKKLKKEFPEARIIIVSNYSDDELRDEAKKAGAEEYFIKDNLMEVKNYIQRDDKL